MLRSIFYIAVLFVATVFLPFWAQMVIFVYAIFVIKHKILVLAPALFADIWYAPHTGLFLNNNKTFLLVSLILLVYFLVVRTTRVRQKYDFEKK
ncbi:hypothetical protein IT402_00415 [Candidatus Nomurabacteria bacterium]|nr:hypothetical protein [Candidatus Nomurabacteria bacterium]